MKKLRLFMVFFCVLLSLPLAYVAWRTSKALDRETQAQVRFFAEQLLDEIEHELTELVRREENRSIDAYGSRNGEIGPSSLSRPPDEVFILGYFQNNPDGSFQTPLPKEGQASSENLSRRVHQLKAVNAMFNRLKITTPPSSTAAAPVDKAGRPEKLQQSAFADRFIKQVPPKKTKTALGQERTRLEPLTPDQALNLAPPEINRPSTTLDAAAGTRHKSAAAMPPAPALDEALPAVESSIRFQAEIAPLQAVRIDEQRMFVFRRIDIGGQLYRQGFVLLITPFLDHLMARHYDSQPIAGYTRLTLRANGVHSTRSRLQAAAANPHPGRIAVRTFPAPFGFLRAEMQLLSLPPSPARRPFNLALALLSVLMAAGLVLIYQSARSVMDLSERRSQFVSAVTHELKTPLTSIRLYIEMLEQGMAATPEQTQEYLRVLSTESRRLTGLINNVLELSRLEQRTRRFNIQNGDLGNVLHEAKSLMAETLAREGFEVRIKAENLPVFAFDREVLIQILINLMENSIKFGRHRSQKQITIAARAADNRMTLSVSDTGPGIPGNALKQIFDDFYRVDSDLGRKTGGTGIGLSLVKKLILAMGGQVRAENNDGAGCTITLWLPLEKNIS